MSGAGIDIFNRASSMNFGSALENAMAQEIAHQLRRNHAAYFLLGSVVPARGFSPGRASGPTSSWAV